MVLPNNMHKEFTLKAFQAGKHVICEKPMAMNSLEAAEMVVAGKKAKRELFIGYRLHYEPHHQEIIRLFTNQKFLGKLNFLREVLGSELEILINGG